MQVMQRGNLRPAVPLVPYDTLDEAIAYVGRIRIRSRCMSSRTIARRSIACSARRTRGGVTVNDTILHIAQHSLPFGGVGRFRHRRLSWRGGIPDVLAHEAGHATGALELRRLLNPPYACDVPAVELILRR